MGKALMITVPASGNPAVSDQEMNLFGYSGASTSEAQTQASATENCTFSKLGVNIISGGSGTNNFQFRDAGANGNQLATRAGAGVAEDTTNTDVLTAGDLFNLAYTDTGTDSVLSWIKGNVEFSSGHGAFHGSASFSNQIAFNDASSTFYLNLAGVMASEGTTEATEAFKVRAYTTFAALQVRVGSNARTTNTIFRNRINNGNGSASITFGSGITGLLTATGLSDAIADGQTINASITTGTGTENLFLGFVVATLKSSSNGQDMWSGGGMERTASPTPSYLAIGGRLELRGFTEAQARVKPGFAAVAKNLRCYISANTYSVNATLKLMKNGSAVLTTTLTAGVTGWLENTVDTAEFDDDDELSFEFNGGTSGSIIVYMVGVTFSPATLGGRGAAMLAQPRFL